MRVFSKYTKDHQVIIKYIVSLYNKFKVYIYNLPCKNFLTESNFLSCLETFNKMDIQIYLLSSKINLKNQKLFVEKKNRTQIVPNYLWRNVI